MDDKVYLMDVKIYNKNKDVVAMIEDVEVSSDSAKDMRKAEKIALKTFLERKYFDETREISLDDYVKTNHGYTASVDGYRYYFIYQGEKQLWKELLYFNLKLKQTSSNIS